MDTHHTHTYTHTCARGVMSVSERKGGKVAMATKAIGSILGDVWLSIALALALVN